MLSAFGRVVKTADLRRKLLFTLAMIVLYRVGTFIPAPGVSYGNVQQCLNANVTSTISSTSSAVAHCCSFRSLPSA